MDFVGEIVSVGSARGKKVMKVALAPNVSMDAIDAYSGSLVKFEVGLSVEADDIEVDAFTGEVIE